MANPVNLTIDLDGSSGNAAGYISGVTNAGWTQRAVVSVVDANKNPVVNGTFQGKGEKNTPIPLTTGGYLLQFTSAVLPLTVTVTLSYDPNGTFQPNNPDKVISNQLVDNQFVETYQITSEDWVDKDYNDLILTATFIKH